MKRDFLIGISVDNVNALFHHGIKGQKWGVRRFQNPDGSLTDEGRERYRYEMSGTRLKKRVYDRYMDKTLPRKNFKRNWSDRLNNDDLVINETEQIHHITPDHDFSINDKRINRRLYAYTDADESIYKGIFAALQRTRDRTVYEVNIDLKKKLRVAGRSTQLDEFKKLENEYGATKIQSELRPLCEKYNHPIPESESDLFAAFIEFGPYIETGNSFKQFSKSIGEHYDALTDLNDIDYSGIGSTKPLIVLDTLASIGNIEISELNDSDIKAVLKSFENQK